MKKQSIILFFISILYCSDIFCQDLKIYTEYYPPFSYQKKDKTIAGIGTIVLLEAAKAGNLKIKKENMFLTSWPYAYDKVLKTPNTMIYIIARSKQREKLFKWVGPVFRNDGVVLFGLRKKQIKINNEKDLKKYLIGAVKNDIAEQIILKKTKITKKQIDNRGDVKDLIKKLQKGRIDLVAYTPISFFYILKNINQKSSDFEIVMKVDTFERYYGFNKSTDPKIIKKFESGLEKIKSSGVYQNLMDSFTKSLKESR